MSQIFGNVMRSVKEFFVEPIPDFGFRSENQETDAVDPLFDLAPLEPLVSQSQPGNQEAVLHALERAAEIYFMANVAPLLRNVPNLRWQIKQMQIRETAENMHVLKEIDKLSPSILNTISKSVLSKLPCAHAIDMSQYYGLSIVPDNELVGRGIAMWANVGQEKIAMHFYFDGEILERHEEILEETTREAPDEDAGAPSPSSPANSFHLRLIEGNAERAIPIAHFPAIIGSSPNVDIQVTGQYVSHQHLVLNWDPVLQCVYLTDRSKHGTYLSSGRKLADGERANLLGEGNFMLTNQANAPRFEYWHGEARGQGTALLPSKAAGGPQVLTKKMTPRSETLINHIISSETARQRATVFKHASEPAKRPLGKPFTFKNLETSAAQPTVLSVPLKPNPLAWLQVRYAKGHVDTVPITTLPFSIGREFTGDGFPIDEAYVKVSRIHLRLQEQRGTSFGVNNESLQRPGQSNLTFNEKGAVNRQFVWPPQPRESAGGWCVLGSNRLDGESVEVRLVAENSY